ncbi:MAG: peptidase U34, partial [Candidatus Korarchaeota archaeon]
SMRDICMHYGGMTRPSQTANSQISILSGKTKIHWFTGTSLPCLSIFKPFCFEAGLPDLGDKPSDKYNPKSYWWFAERFHRMFQTCYKDYISEYAAERDALQSKIIKEVDKIIASGDLKGMYSLSKSAFEEERKLIEKWCAKIRVKRLPFLYGRKWKKVNKQAGLKI